MIRPTLSRQRLGGEARAERTRGRVDPRTHFVYFPLESGWNGKPRLLAMRPR
jgi:hypothetical protein